jgi:hypothetical protein
MSGLLTWFKELDAPKKLTFLSTLTFMIIIGFIEPRALLFMWGVGTVIALMHWWIDG